MYPVLRVTESRSCQIDQILQSQGEKRDVSVPGYGSQDRRVAPMGEM